MDVVLEQHKRRYVPSSPGGQPNRRVLEKFVLFQHKLAS